ncbi:DUF6476 family protein [Paracoccus sediminicola]|uniref:DUF6476 family protein n=1 Tax=Paracoccus sediminicola TaxID=3017783 RepID=UPI0022F0DB5C|nr:DUF6476 family protein [Paracoccus sediminicola]WBU55581.1 DUF6476 family protein [Paracoccus sediminicola]
MTRDIKDAPARREDQSPEQDAVPHLMFLKAMVGGLAVAMVLGLGVIAAILWIRLSAPPLPALPEAVTLPEDATAEAVTFADDRLIVVTDQGEVLVYDPDGALRQRVTLETP